MTRTHAALQLLHHGELCFGDFQEITGWPSHDCAHTLDYLLRHGLIERTGGPRTGIYHLPDRPLRAPCLAGRRQEAAGRLVALRGQAPGRTGSGIHGHSSRSDGQAQGATQ